MFKRLEVFGSESCKPCKNAIEWLNKNNISYIYYDVDDKESKTLVDYYAVLSVPTFILKSDEEEKMYTGFSPKIKKIILEFIGRKEANIEQFRK